MHIPSSHILLAGAWMLFCVLHSMLASIRFKHKAQQWMGKGYRSLRLYYTLFAFITFAGVIIYQVSIASFFVYQSTGFTRVAGIIIGLPGLAIMSLSIYKYFLRLSGLYGLIHEQPGQLLMRSGIHQYVRHPLYLGTFLFIWGLFIFIPYCSLLIADIIITTYTLLGTRLEEMKLKLEFGEAYQQYQDEVPMIIPKMMRDKERL